MISVPTKISDIVQLMRDNGSYSNEAPYFDFGTHEYLSGILKDKSKSTSHYNKVFPFIALILDIPENNNGVDYYAEISFNMIFATATNPKESNLTRETTIFKNILYPLLKDFLTQMWNSHFFKFDQGSNGLDISFAKTDYYFYNSTEGSNKWNRYVDAIEIQFNNLKLNNEDTC